jgi:hypothetical protein
MERALLHVRSWIPRSRNIVPPNGLLMIATALTFTKPDAVDMVLFCGSPGAGKSSFYWRHFQPLGYERVNQDVLKTVSGLVE